MQYWNRQRKAMLLFWILLLAVYEIVIFLLIGLIFDIKQLNFKNWWLVITTGWTHNIWLGLVIIVVLTICYCCLAFIMIHFKAKSTTYIKSASTKEHGGAEWIIDEANQVNSSHQIKKFNEIYPLANASVQQPGWVVRAKKLKNTTIFNVRSGTQALCLGATGSGKTQKIIIPGAVYNAKLTFEQKPCMVFTDPKGELYEKLGNLLKAQGYDVLILNIREPKFSSGWNPLNMAYKYYYDAVTFRENNIKTLEIANEEDLEKQVVLLNCYIHDMNKCNICFAIVKSENKYNQVYLFKDQYWLYGKNYVDKFVYSNILELKSSAYEEVEDLVATLFPIPKTDNPMWTQNAARMTAGVIYALLEVLDNDVNDLPLAKFNLTTVANLLANQENLVRWFQNLGHITPNSKAFITAAPVVNSAEVTRQGAFSNLGPALKIFEDLGIQNITCKNDIDLFQFTEKPKALFLIIPDEKTNRHIIGSLFIAQLYKASVFVANNNGGKLQRTLQFYLDEFGNMPMIPNFASFITVARSRNMFFLLVLQDFKQLYDKYDRQNGMTIRNNCNLNIYIQTNDHETADAYSKMIGDYTVISSSINKHVSKTGSKGGSSSQTGIPLIKGSDLMRLRDPYGVVIYAKENPAKVYMEYAYNCPIFNLGVYNPINKMQVNVIDFYQDHYFNLLEYNIYTKLKAKYAAEWQEEIVDFNETTNNRETEADLFDQENIIRDQIHQLELQEYESLSTEAKITLATLRNNLMLVKNKLNTFVEKAE